VVEGAGEGETEEKGEGEKRWTFDSLFFIDIKKA